MKSETAKTLKSLFAPTGSKPWRRRVAWIAAAVGTGAASPNGNATGRPQLFAAARDRESNAKCSDRNFALKGDAAEAMAENRAAGATSVAFVATAKALAVFVNASGPLGVDAISHNLGAAPSARASNSFASKALREDRAHAAIHIAKGSALSLYTRAHAASWTSFVDRSGFRQYNPSS